MSGWCLEVSHLLDMLTQPSVDGCGSLAELQLRIYWHGGGGVCVDEELNKLGLSCAKLRPA